MSAIRLERQHLIRENTNAKCVLVTHLLNPWGVLKGYSPDFDGVDGITRFRNDCVEAFCRRANYIYEHDGR